MPQQSHALELSHEQRHECLSAALAAAASELSWEEPDEVWDARIDELYVQLCADAAALLADTLEERERLWVEAVARVCEESAAFYSTLALRCRRRGAMIAARRAAGRQEKSHANH
jgi:hypothetical protein